MRKSLVCLIRSLRTVTSLSIAAASVPSRRSVSIWFGPAFKICFIISNVLTDLGTLSVERYEQFRLETGDDQNIPLCQARHQARKFGIFHTYFLSFEIAQ